MQLTLLLLFTNFFFAGEIIKEHSFSGKSNGEQVTLRWITEKENQVYKFEIERRTNVDASFSYIASVNPQGMPSQYEFIDYSAYKSFDQNFYQYRIKVVFNDETLPAQYSEIISVSHFVSGVRKTWGSIKAMFR
jgi:predicted restriction endonuclease